MRRREKSTVKKANRAIRLFEVMMLGRREAFSIQYGVLVRGRGKKNDYKK